MTILTTPDTMRALIIGALVAAVLVVIAAILWLAARDKSPGSRRPSAKTSHRAPRAERTFRLGGVLGDLVERTPAPVPASAVNPFDAFDYPEPGSPAAAYTPTLRAIGAATGTKSRFEDTSSWAAITGDGSLVVDADTGAFVAAPAPAPATRPQPVLTIEDAPAEPVLDGKAEKHLTAFLDAHDEQDAAEADQPAAESDEAKKDRVAFESGADQ